VKWKSSLCMKEQGHGNKFKAWGNLVLFWRSVNKRCWNPKKCIILGSTQECIQRELSPDRFLENNNIPNLNRVELFRCRSFKYWGLFLQHSESMKPNISHEASLSFLRRFMSSRTDLSCQIERSYDKISKRKLPNLWVDQKYERFE